MPMNVLLSTEFPKLQLFKKGKVRDIYEFGGNLLIVATDRISAFDVVMPNGIPDKGKVLTQLSIFWFEFTKDIIKNHLISGEADEFPDEVREYKDILSGRSMLVEKSKPLPVECVVRGYLAGSGWKEYCQKGTVCGIELPRGLRESEKLPEPIFTPATKAEAGHDINLTEQQAGEIVGRQIFEKLKAKSLALYQKAARYAESKGIIIADTKFEFGKNGDEIILIDEVLTPDSSRFWPQDEYRAGSPQKSFDKQFARDYLEGLDWDKTPPAPVLPDEIVQKTREKYLEAFRRLVGKETTV